MSLCDFDTKNNVESLIECAYLYLEAKQDTMAVLVIMERFEIRWRMTYYNEKTLFQRQQTSAESWQVGKINTAIEITK